MTEVVDTNVILRFLVGDDKKQQQQAEKWFKQAEKGKRKLIIKSLVIAEVCFVLESFYKKSRKEVAKAMEVFLSQRWLKVEDRKVMVNLWKWYIKNMHFVDSFLLAWVKENKGKILSFDKKLLQAT